MKHRLLRLLEATLLFGSIIALGYMFIETGGLPPEDIRSVE